MQNSLYHTQCFCFFLFSVLCSTAFSPQDVLCCPFPNQKLSCTKYKKRCHDIFHGQNSLTLVNFSFSKPIAKKHPCSKGSLGYPIHPIHGHSHCSSNRNTCWEENFSEGLLHCATDTLEQGQDWIQFECTWDPRAPRECFSNSGPA